MCIDGFDEEKVGAIVVLAGLNQVVGNIRTLNMHVFCQFESDEKSFQSTSATASPQSSENGVRSAKEHGSSSLGKRAASSNEPSEAIRGTKRARVQSNVPGVIDLDEASEEVEDYRSNNAIDDVATAAQSGDTTSSPPPSSSTKLPHLVREMRSQTCTRVC
jgi:hypothetical protein